MQVAIGFVLGVLSTLAVLYGLWRLALTGAEEEAAREREQGPSIAL